MIVVRWSRRSLILLTLVFLAVTLVVIVVTKGNANYHKLLHGNSDGQPNDEVRADTQRELARGGESDLAQNAVAGFNSEKSQDTKAVGNSISAGNSSHDVKSASGVSAALLRILVLTYNRGKSLARCLTSLNEAEYDGEKVEMEIHIDRGKDGQVHQETLEEANKFAFKHGNVSVHVKPKHGGVLGQWLTSWRLPQDNASEIAVFVEDDITLSPYFARYLRRVHEKYDDYPGINGYALQTESIRHGKGSKSSLLEGPKGEVVFLYPVLGSWGFSPHTGWWRDFVRWYNESSKEKGFIPSVPGLMPSDWYKSLHKKGRADSMWTMWHIYHAYKNKLYTLYAHLPEGKGFAFNWKEPGEHYNGRAPKLTSHALETWKEEVFTLPDKLQILDAKGENTGKIMTATGVV